MKRFLSFFFLSVFCLLIGNYNVEACDCSGRPKNVKGIQTCGYYLYSENVFIGLAEKVEIDNKIGSMRVTFSVEKSIRGTNEKTVEVFTSSNE